MGDGTVDPTNNKNERVQMGQYFQIHPENPQVRLIKQAAQIVSSGGIVALLRSQAMTSHPF